MLNQTVNGPAPMPSQTVVVKPYLTVSAIGLLVATVYAELRRGIFSCAEDGSSDAV